MRIKDLSGQRFGRLTAINRTEQKRKSCYLWLCKCDCGNETLVDTYYLTHGQRKSCGCLVNLPKRDLSGQVFGRLTVISPTEKRKHGGFVWECRCECGNTVFVSTYQLTSGVKRSCECLHVETATAHVNTIRGKNHIDGTNVGAIKHNRIFANNTSGVRGVSWHAHRGKWYARLTFQGQRHSLGYFDSMDDAAKARKDAEEKYFGEYLKSKTT